MNRINAKNIKAYFQAYFRKYMIGLNRFLSKFGITFIAKVMNIKDITDRLEYRSYHANKACLISGKCIHCKCDVPELFLSDKGCEINCYNELPKKEY